MLSDVRPCTDEFKCVACLVGDDSESVLDPDVVPVSMTKTILDRAASSFNQRTHFFQNPRGVFRMQMVRPAFRISSHLNGRIAHDVPKILADKCAGIVARCFRCVNDRWTNGN